MKLILMPILLFSSFTFAAEMDCVIDASYQLKDRYSGVIYLQKNFRHVADLDNDIVDMGYKFPIFDDVPAFQDGRPSWSVTTPFPGLSASETLAVMPEFASTEVVRSGRPEASVNIVSPHGGFLGFGGHGSWSRSAPAMINMNMPNLRIGVLQGGYTGVGGKSNADQSINYNFTVFKDSDQMLGFDSYVDGAVVRGVSKLSSDRLDLSLDYNVSVSCVRDYVEPSVRVDSSGRDTMQQPFVAPSSEESSSAAPAQQR